MHSQEGDFPPGSFLADIKPESRAAFLNIGIYRTFESRATLVRQGDTTSHALLLVSGCVKVTATTADGHLSLLAIRAAGELIGELAGLDGQPRIATVVAAGPVRAKSIAQFELHRFLNDHPDVALALSSSVATKLRAATRRRVDFGGLEVRVRLARVLLELANRYGVPDGDRIKITVPLTQPELAALVAAAEPTVHRALAQLRKERIVGTGYRHVVVRDRARLATLAGE